MKEYLTLEKLNAYNQSFDLSNKVWSIVEKWDWFAKQTVGTQWVRSMDSISAIIAEGFGRYGKKDKVHFYHFSLGSYYETTDWFKKAKIRGLLCETEAKELESKLFDLPKQIHALIKFTNEKLLT